MDGLLDTPTKATDDGALDPNLALMTQQQKATSDATTLNPPAPPPLPSSSLQPQAPTPAPTGGSAQLAAAPPPPPAPSTANTGTYGAMAYPDAVQQAYKDSQARQAATGVEEAPADYSMAGMSEAGLWGMSAADTQANADRAASIANDPTSAPAMKQLAGLSGFGTPGFDRSLNNGSNPALAAQVSQLLATAKTQAPPTAAPGGTTSPTMPNTTTGDVSGTSVGAGGGLGGLFNRLPPTTTGLGGLFDKLPPTGGASDAGTPSSGLGAKMPVAGATSAPGSAGVAIGQQILPGASGRLTGLEGMVDQSTQNLANVDRFKLAQDRFDQSAQDSDPAYQLALRQATQRGAGRGQIGSGMLRTSYGDLAMQRGQQLDSLRKGFLNDALEGTIGDNFKKTDALSGLEKQVSGEEASNRDEMRGERGYQGSLEEQSFQRALAQWQMQNAAQQQNFDNGVTLTKLGDSGNPADYYTQLAKQYGVDPSVLMGLASSFSSKGTTASPKGQSPQIPQAPIPNGSFDLPSLPAGTANG